MCVYFRIMIINQVVCTCLLSLCACVCVPVCACSAIYSLSMSINSSMHNNAIIRLSIIVNITNKNIIHRMLIFPAVVCPKLSSDGTSITYMSNVIK